MLNAILLLNTMELPPLWTCQAIQIYVILVPSRIKRNLHSNKIQETVEQVQVCTGVAQL